MISKRIKAYKVKKGYYMSNTANLGCEDLYNCYEIDSVFDEKDAIKSFAINQQGSFDQNVSFN